ncbi:MAG: carbohydrate ABC transporter permease, partial [Angelakisella sp.]
YIGVFADKQIFQAYYNTLWYTLVGTTINIIVTLPAAYALSRTKYCLKKPVMFFFSVTMFFSGGMVPSYLLIQNLHLYNTRWAMVLPGAISVFNLVMARTFFSSTIPDELAESAKIDGANDLQIFIKIVLPLSKAIIAVLVLYYGVGHWNAFFNALIYLRDQELAPLSIYLRRLLILGTTNYGSAGISDFMMVDDQMAIMGITQRMKYCSIVVTMLPIMLVYPFFQKYFAKGVMVGSLKA